MMRRLLLAFALLLMAAPAFAVNPDEVLADPALEARARALSAELRCMVCQNQSIDDSDADLAHDLRVLVRDRIKAGDDDEHVIAYIVSRYGEFVLLKPRVNKHTVLLWLVPPLALMGGGIALWVYSRRRERVGNLDRESLMKLTAAEEARLEKLLGAEPPARSDGPQT